MLKQIAKKIRKGQTISEYPYWELITESELTEKELKVIAARIADGSTDGCDPCEWELQYDEDIDDYSEEEDY